MVQKRRKSISACNKILIVDDTPFNVEILQMMIQTTFGICSDTAFSGEEAIEKVKLRAQ
jgi:hypothetical protein